MVYRFLFLLALLVPMARPSAQALPEFLDELADAAAVVVTGRVADVSVHRDAGFIYTYAAVTVDEVLKGRVDDAHLVVKVLGGTLPDVGLYIADQATFTRDEDVLLFLGVRPRDASLYTVGLSRGKWRVLPDLKDGGRTAINGSLQARIDDLRSEIAESRAHAEAFVTAPPERDLAAPAYTLIPAPEGGPARWHEADDGTHIPVDYQTIPGGLPGGGSSQLDAALGAWNGVGTRLQLDRAATGPHSCPAESFTGNGRIALYWNDPCLEFPDNDPTFFGVGGGFFTPGFQKTINGVTFNGFLQGLAILNNVGPHLTDAACLQDAVTHVLGHAVGFGHSGDSGALMYATLRGACASGASGLAADDMEGLRFIYPAVASGGSPPHAPTAITNSVTLDTVTLSWTPATSGGPAQSYVLEAGTAPGLSNITTITLNSANPSTVVGAVPPGIYHVRVRARNPLGTSGPSPDTVVNVGPCTAPGVPTNLAYTTADNLVSLTWSPPATGITQGYWLYAGLGPGLSNALVMQLGSTPAFSGTAVFGDYYVRVAARNSCAVGAPTADLLVSVRPCTTPPSAPTGLGYTVSGNVVTLTWNAPSTGNLPSRYQIRAGSSPGASNLVVQTTTNNATSFTATAARGTYYVRVRGVNNCGESVDSTEATVIVP